MAQPHRFIAILEELRGLSTLKYWLKHELGRNGGKRLSRAEHHSKEHRRQRGANHHVSPLQGVVKIFPPASLPWESQWRPRASPDFLPKPYENTIVAWFQHIIWHRLDKYRAQVHRALERCFIACLKGLIPFQLKSMDSLSLTTGRGPKSLEGFQPCSYKTQSLVARNVSGSWKSQADKMQISHLVQTHAAAQRKPSNSILISFAFVSLLALSIVTTRFSMSCSWKRLQDTNLRQQKPLWRQATSPQWFVFDCWRNSFSV